MTIRKMTIDDYDAVYALWSAQPGIGLHDPEDSRAGMEYYLRRNPDTCFVAETTPAKATAHSRLATPSSEGNFNQE